MATLPTLTPESWQQERLTTYLDIAQEVQTFRKQLKEAEAAIKTLKAQKPDLAIKNIPADIATYNQAHANDVEPDLNAITDVQQAEKAFTDAKAQAWEIHALLWREGNETEFQAMREITQWEDTRREVLTLVRVRVPRWEKRVGEVAGVASALCA